MKGYLLTACFLLVGLLAGCKGVESTNQDKDNEPPVMAEEEYKNSCQTFDYREYFRNDQEHVGEKILVDLTVSQVMEGEFRGSDVSGYEYYVTDMRDENGKFRLISDDRVTIYGEYTGVRQITRPAGDYKEDIFCIDARYMVLHEEDSETESEPGRINSGKEPPALLIERFSGIWRDQYSQRCQMSIEYLKENQFLIVIMWSSSASDDTSWTMTGYYDSTTGQLNYQDGEMTNYHYVDSGNTTSEVVYDDGEGNFYISGGYLYWNDLTAHDGDDCYFKKSGEENQDSVVNRDNNTENISETTDAAADREEPETSLHLETELSDDKVEYMLPYSDSRLLTEADIAGFTQEELRIAKNEIYARRGRIFTSDDLKEYFGSKSWYHGFIEPDQFSESMFNQIEKDNILFIQKYIDQ